MADWWESAQPRGAKPIPKWLVGVFVLCVAAVGCTLWYSTIERASALLAVLGAMAWKAILFYTRKMDRPATRDPDRPQDIADTSD